MDVAFLRIALLLYLTAAGAFHRLSAHAPGRAPAHGPRCCSSPPSCFHGVEIATRSLSLGHMPVVSYDEGLSLPRLDAPRSSTCCSTAAPGWRCSGRSWLRSPSCSTLVAFAVALGSDGAAHHALKSWWLPVHVTLAFLGNAVFAIAFATSLVYLFEDNRLKAKRPSRIRRIFPSLEKLDELNYRLLAWGFRCSRSVSSPERSGRTSPGAVLELGVARDLVARHLVALRDAAPWSDRRLAWPARRGADHPRVRGPARLLRQREPLLPGPARRSFGS